MKVVDLFCGTGTFSSIAKELGWEVVYAIDMCKYAQTIYDANHDLKMTKKDIRHVEETQIPSHDVLCAGFPCQPFSKAGKRLGIEHSLGDAFSHVLRFVKHHRSKWVVLENVKNLIFHKQGKTFETMVNSLQNLGYRVWWHILKTHIHTYLPHHRDRVYVICHNGMMNYNLKPMEVPTRHLSHFINKQVCKKYYYTKGKLFDNKHLVTKSIDQGVVYYKTNTIREFKKKGVVPCLVEAMGTCGNRVPYFKDTTGNLRRLTPRECFDLQGYPSTYVIDCGLSDKRLYQLVGRSCSLPCVKMVLSAIP